MLAGLRGMCVCVFLCLCGGAMIPIPPASDPAGGF